MVDTRERQENIKYNYYNDSLHYDELKEDTLHPDYPHTAYKFKFTNSHYIRDMDGAEAIHPTWQIQNPHSSQKLTPLT